VLLIVAGAYLLIGRFISHAPAETEMRHERQ